MNSTEPGNDLEWSSISIHHGRRLFYIGYFIFNLFLGLLVAVSIYITRKRSKQLRLSPLRTSAAIGEIPFVLSLFFRIVYCIIGVAVFNKLGLRAVAIMADCLLLGGPGDVVVWTLTFALMVAGLIGGYTAYSAYALSTTWGAKVVLAEASLATAYAQALAIFLIVTMIRLRTVVHQLLPLLVSGLLAASGGLIIFTLYKGQGIDSYYIVMPQIITSALVLVWIPWRRKMYYEASWEGDMAKAQMEAKPLAGTFTLEEMDAFGLEEKVFRIDDEVEVQEPIYTEVDVAGEPATSTQFSSTHVDDFHDDKGKWDK